MPLSFSKAAEYIDCFNGFSINRKTLLNKLTAALEQKANEEEHYLKTAELLSGIEAYIDELAGDIFVGIECAKVNVNALLKMAGISVCDDYDEPLERILDYMELVREYDRERLFVFVNMRSYFEDDELNRFFETVLSKELSVFLIDAFEGELLPHENRLVIDADLCEF